MTRSTTLKVANYLLYLVTCCLAGIGLVLQYKLPSGGQSRGLILLGLKRHDWAEIHFFLGIAFVLIALGHLVLNRSWVAKVANSGNRTLLLLSIVFGLFFLVAPLLVPTEEDNKAINSVLHGGVRQ